MCTGHYSKYTNCKNEVVTMYTVIMQRVVTCVYDCNTTRVVICALDTTATWQSAIPNVN